MSTEKNKEQMSQNYCMPMIQQPIKSKQAEIISEFSSSKRVGEN